jgi:hypothetical protein
MPKKRNPRRSATLECLYFDEKGGLSRKWVPSSNYELIAGDLLSLIKGCTIPRMREHLFIPYVLMLAAAFEANINDWFIVHACCRYGKNSYKSIAEGYLTMSFRSKLHCVVSVLSDSRFVLNERSKIVERLEKLIDVRNRLIHPRAWFFEDVSKKSPELMEEVLAKAYDHPLMTIKYQDCLAFKAAMEAFDRLFFRKYDSRKIRANSLVCKNTTEMPEVGPA